MPTDHVPRRGLSPLYFGVCIAERSVEYETAVVGSLLTILKKPKDTATKSTVTNKP